MQVAYLADALYQNMAAGTARYTLELAAHLQQLPGVELRMFTLYPPEMVAHRGGERGYPVAKSVSRPTRQAGLRYLQWHWLGMAGSAAAEIQQADLVHTPSLQVPPRLGKPLVVTVLDLTFSLFPHYHTRRTRMVAGSGLRRAVRDADAFIAISEHTAQDLARLRPRARGRIFVVPLAAEEWFQPVTDAERISRVMMRYGIDAPYVLHVGTLEPRKNIGLLLDAFAALPKTDVKLVLVGAKGWKYDELFQTLARLGLTDRVIVTGFVANEDLPALFSGARIFVYPSRYEGFGLPVLEAMQCGAPVITTNVSSMPEVAGEAAWMVSPDDTAGLTDALGRMLNEPRMREEMRGKGLQQAAQFSWRKTAEMTAEIYRHVLQRQ